jgi:mevalonate kinase
VGGLVLDSKTMSNGVNGFHRDAHHLQPNGNGNGLTKSLSTRSIDRKMSTPMMPAFMVSAPGKVIVFGEHAVVHGKVT